MYNILKNKGFNIVNKYNQEKEFIEALGYKQLILINTKVV